MGYTTRDLLSFALSRGAGELITLYTTAPVPNGDGTYSPNTVETTVKARVVDLQPNEIKRLQDRGITLRKGVSIAIPSELAKVPDKIKRANGTMMKIVEFTNSENGTVMIADVPSLGPAA